MSLIIVETVAEQPLTDAMLHEAYQRVLPCLTAQNTIWRYSLLAANCHRMLCFFNAPDAESVRESYRRVGLPSRPIWAGDLMKPEVAQFQENSTLYVIEATYPLLNRIMAKLASTAQTSIAITCLVMNLE